MIKQLEARSLPGFEWSFLCNISREDLVFILAVGDIYWKHAALYSIYKLLSQEHFKYVAILHHSDWVYNWWMELSCTSNCRRAFELTQKQEMRLIVMFIFD